MGKFKRFCMIVFVVAAVLGIGVLAALWFAWEPLFPAIAWLMAMPWFYVVEAVLLGITAVGLLVVLIRALTAPGKNSQLEIERDNAKVRIYLHCARPGVVIGKGGEQIEQYRLTVEKMIGKPVALNIVEVKQVDTNAQLVAENIAQQLEKRIGFRRAMKNAMGRAMRMGARGIKTQVSGRLGGAEIARTEHYHDGTIPLQTLRADIDYGFAEAATTYGRIGVKVWIYKGEVLTQALRTTPRTLDTSKPYQERRERPRRDRRDGDRRQGGFNRDRRQGGFNRDNNRGPRPAGQANAPKEGGAQ